MTLIFLPHLDVICDLLLNRRTVKKQTTTDKAFLFQNLSTKLEVHLNDKLQTLQSLTARVMTGTHYWMPISEIFSELGWSNLKEKEKKQKALEWYSPTEYQEDILTRNIGRSVYNLRISRRNLAFPVVKANYYQNCFAYTGAKVWNALPG